jgi:hypothetical protein
MNNNNGGVGGVVVVVAVVDIVVVGVGSAEPANASAVAPSTTSRATTLYARALAVKNDIGWRSEMCRLYTRTNECQRGRTIDDVAGHNTVRTRIGCKEWFGKGKMVSCEWRR